MQAVACRSTPKEQVVGSPGAASSTGSTGGPANSQLHGLQPAPKAAPTSPPAMAPAPSPALSLSLSMQKDPALATGSPVSVELRLVQHSPASWSPVNLKSLAARLSTYAAESPPQPAAVPGSSPVQGLVTASADAPAQPATGSAPAAIPGEAARNSSLGSSCTSSEGPAVQQAAPDPAMQLQQSERAQPVDTPTPQPGARQAPLGEQGGGFHSFLVSGYADRTYCVHGIRCGVRRPPAGSTATHMLSCG